MPQTYRFKLHSNGPALWPGHKPLKEVEELRDTTPETTWETTYQGNPTAPGGVIFKREWWQQPDRRYRSADPTIHKQAIARWIAWDTALKDKENSAYTVGIVAELWPDYRLVIREVYRDKLVFPDLIPQILAYAMSYNHDNKLYGILIEDKASGISALQTIQDSAEQWIADLLIPFEPSGSKEIRAKQASPWAKNGSILLPYPDGAVPWLIDFEDELFSFPGSISKDQVDTLVMLILYLEHYLSLGYQARSALLPPPRHDDRDENQLVHDYSYGEGNVKSKLRQDLESYAKS